MRRKAAAKRRIGTKKSGFMAKPLFGLFPLFFSGKVVDEILKPLFRRMLHDDDVRELPAEPVVIIGRQVILL